MNIISSPLRNALHFGLFILLITPNAFSAGSRSKKEVPFIRSEKADAIPLYNEGTAALKEREYDQATTHLRAALKKDAKLAEAHNNLAFALRKQGEEHYQESLSHYNQAIRLNRNLVEAYMYRGVLHVAMGEPGKALKDYKRLEKLSPELAKELEWVIENGKEKEPAHFFGVAGIL